MVMMMVRIMMIMIRMFTMLMFLMNFIIIIIFMHPAYCDKIKIICETKFINVAICEKRILIDWFWK